MDLTELCQKAERAILKQQTLGFGSDGVIYDLDDKVVLKLFNGNFYRGKKKGNSQTAAEFEYGIGRDLFDHQMQVPEFYSLYQYRGPLSYVLSLWLGFLFSKEEPCWGIFMQRINGDDVFLSDKAQEAQRQLDEQLKLAQEAGYVPRDIFLNHNTLFDPEQNKLYLIDFTRWEKK